MDLSSKHYDLNELGEDDPRLVSGKKDAVIVQTILGIFTVVPILIGYLLSPSIADLEGGAVLPTLLGYPTWVMVPAILYVCEYIILIIYTSKFMKKPSLEARMTDEDQRLMEG